MTLASDIDLELYPVSDGKPMADSSLHYRWIVTIKENLEALFANDPMVVVEADTFWYAVPRLRSQSKEERVEPQAPDIMVIFGRPKGDRGSYKQHEEGNIPPQVVFEIYSKSNKVWKWDEKFEFYEHYGVEEYYCFYPEDNILEVWMRTGTDLRRANWQDVWVSPRLGIQFDLTGETMQIYDPDGNAFRSFSEERERADRERQQREQAEAEKERMAAKLRELGIDPELL